MKSETSETNYDTHDDLARATTILGTVSVLLDTVDWDGIKATLDKAESVGPFLDPTAFMRSMESGTFARNRAVVTATITYLDVLRKIDAEIQTNDGEL